MRQLKKRNIRKAMKTVTRPNTNFKCERCDKDCHSKIGNFIYLRCPISPSANPYPHKTDEGRRRHEIDCAFLHRNIITFIIFNVQSLGYRFVSASPSSPDNVSLSQRMNKLIFMSSIRARAGIPTAAEIQASHISNKFQNT